MTTMINDSPVSKRVAFVNSGGIEVDVYPDGSIRWTDSVGNQKVLQFSHEVRKLFQEMPEETVQV